MPPTLTDALSRLDKVFEEFNAILDSPSRLETAADILERFSGNNLIQAMVTECGQRLGADFCAMSLLDDTTSHIVASCPIMEGAVREHSYCQFVIASGAPVAIPDARKSHFLLRMPQYETVAAYLGVPVHAPNGERLGALCAIQSRPRQWGPADIALLEAYSRQITSVLIEDRL